MTVADGGGPLQAAKAVLDQILRALSPHGLGQGQLPRGLVGGVDPPAQAPQRGRQGRLIDLGGNREALRAPHAR